MLQWRRKNFYNLYGALRSFCTADAFFVMSDIIVIIYLCFREYSRIFWCIVFAVHFAKSPVLTAEEMIIIIVSMVTESRQ